MQKLNGIWWTLNQKQIPGELTITDENKIYLITYEKLYDSNVINGFVEGKKITLVDVELDRTDIYYAEAKKTNEEYDVINNKKIEYSKYKYIAQMIIFGHTYERKGDIRVRSLNLKYTNLDKWVNLKNETKKDEKGIISFQERKTSPKARLEKFDLSIAKPYILTQDDYNIQVRDDTSILIDNIGNSYIQSIEGIVTCIQFFLVLCMGDNINIEKIDAKDIFDRQIEIIIGHGKSNYENRIIFKNIIKYQDIENILKKVLKKWIEIYEDNALLMASFVNLQRKEELLPSEYTNLMTAIDSLYLLIINEETTKEHFINIVQEILNQANFAFGFTDKQIYKIAEKTKDARRYFVHSNKTQEEVATSNINVIMNIMCILIETIRINIMLQIGIKRKTIKDYYTNITRLEKVKQDIINNINIEDEIIDERIKEGKNIMKPMSKKDRENIAELNAIMGTHYRETAYDLDNTEDLIEAVENITAEYMDYTQYWSQLLDILENFDQSIEVFHPEKWFKNIIDENVENNLINETFSSVMEAEENMSELRLKIEDECKKIWRTVLLGKNKEAQKIFIGNKTKYSKEEVEEALEDVIENIFELGHENVVSEDCKNFANSFKQVLKEIRRKNR